MQLNRGGRGEVEMKVASSKPKKRDYEVIGGESPGQQGKGGKGKMDMGTATEPEVTETGKYEGAGGDRDVENGGAFDGEDDVDTDSDDSEVSEMIREASKSYWRMFTVTIMGTLDDMLVFTALVSGSGNGESSKNIGVLSLLVGSTGAAGCVGGISLGLSR